MGNQLKSLSRNIIFERNFHLGKNRMNLLLIFLKPEFASKFLVYRGHNNFAFLSNTQVFTIRLVKGFAGLCSNI